MKEKRNLKQKAMFLFIVSLILFVFCTSCSKMSKGGKEVVLSMIDWNDSSKTFRDAFNEQFMKEHPGVTIEYTTVTIDQFKNSVVTAIKSGDAPDLFPVPVGMTLTTAVAEGWFAELDPYLDKKFLSTIKPEHMIEDVAYSKGKLYALPFQGALNGAMVFYNKTLLAEAGVTKVPETYSEFIETCKKVTKAGKGKYYGLIEGAKQSNRMENLIRALVGLAGGKISISTSTALTVNGVAPYYTPEVRGAFEFYAQLAADGSIHPDSVSITAPEARAMFAQGAAAFLCQGSWCIPVWAAKNPDFTNYGVMVLPKPDGYTDPSAISARHMAGSIGISVDCENKELAAEYLKGMYSSKEGGYQASNVAAGGFDSVVKGVNEKYMKSNPKMLEYWEAADPNQAIQPNPAARDSSVGAFYAEVKMISPNFATILQGVFANSIKGNEWDAYLKKFDEETTKEWKRAAEASGVDYGIFEFPNWVVGEDYTQDKYEELKK